MSDNVRIAENIKAIIQSGGFRESKLTDWANEPTVEALKSDINNAQTFHSAQTVSYTHLTLPTILLV